MGMGKCPAEWMIVIISLLIFITVQVEAEAGVIRVSVNSSDWSKMLLQSKYRANALTSRLHAASSKSNSTYRRQLSAIANVPVVSGNSDGSNYVVVVGFGTPQKNNIKMNFDTASDVSWLRCDESSPSSTLKRLDCRSCYRQVGDIACNGKNQCILETEYTNGDQITAHMSQDTLWVGSQSFESFGFGCGTDFSGIRGNPSIGLLALGRNSLSLPSQAKRRVFSYCLPDFLDPKQKGSLSVGDAASIPSTSKSFTAMLSNPIVSSWYFVGISGISVGGTRLNIPPKAFEFHSGGGGTIVDSGVLMSQLVQPAYDAVRGAFLKQMKLSPTKPQTELKLDACFTYSGDIEKLQIPPITLHFKDGFNLPVSQNGILTRVSERAICLAFLPATNNDFNIIGALQQQGYTISFDQDSKRIGFAPAPSCP